MTFPRALGLLSLCLISLSALSSENKLSIVHTHESPHFGELFSEFTQQTGIDLDITWIDQSVLKAKLIIETETRKTPDIIFCPSDFVGLKDYVELGEVPRDLITYAISEDNLKSSEVNGKLYGIPIISGNHLLLYYNKSLVKTPAQSWEALAKQRNQLAEDISLIQWSFMEMYWFVPFITGHGSRPFIDGRPNMDSTAVKEALEFIWGFSKKYGVDTTCAYDCTMKMFSEGKSAYTINGIWSYSQFKNILGENLGVALLPNIDENRMRSYFSTIVAAFPRHSIHAKKSKNIRLFVEFIQSEKFQQKVWTDINELPVDAKVISRVSGEGNQDLEIILEALNNSLPMPTEKNMLYVWEAMLKGYSRYGSGAMSSHEAAVFMQKLTERSINR